MTTRAICAPPGAARIVAVIFVGLTLSSGMAWTQFQSSPPTQSTQEKGPSPRFDTRIREDFFAGMSGDLQRFDRAMQLATDALAKDPNNAEAKVWHGAGTYMLAKRWFREGDYPRALQSKQNGLREMDDAVALAPDNIAVLIPRAAILLSAAPHVPDKEESKHDYEKSVADYEKVLQLQSAYFQNLGEHPRGELLGALADGWSALGNQEKSRAYLKRITTELPGSLYADRATALLSKPPSQGALGITCLGCHVGAP